MENIKNEEMMALEVEDGTDEEFDRAAQKAYLEASVVSLAIIAGVAVWQFVAKPAYLKWKSKKKQSLSLPNESTKDCIES